MYGSTPPPLHRVANSRKSSRTQLDIQFWPIVFSSLAFFLIQMHHSAETIQFLLNLIDSSPLAMVVTQTTDSSPASTASSQVHVQE